MAKLGSDKNTKNKGKHAKLMDRKKKKDREKKDARAERMRLLKQRIKEEEAKK